MHVEDFLGCNQKEGQLVVGGIGRKVKILQAHRYLSHGKKGEGSSGYTNKTDL